MVRNKYTKENLAIAIKQCVTWAEVCRYFDVKPLTGAASVVKRETQRA